MDSKSTARTGVVHFGVFRVEVKPQELYKNGFRVKLQNQAFQALTLLLERAHEEFARAYFRKGMPAEAIAETLATAESPAEARAIARAYKASGYRGFLQWDLKTLFQKSRSQYVPPFSFAWDYALLNDRDNAFRWLERAFAEHETGTFFISALPEFDPLRSDPRYQTLIRRTGLPN